MKMYIFEEWNGGAFALFTSEEQREAFLKQYFHAMIDIGNDPPQHNSDYSLSEAEVNPDFNEWWNS